MSEIKDMRLRAGVTQQGLAALLGITQATLSRWEAGKIKIREHQKLAVKAALSQASEAA